MKRLIPLLLIALMFIVANTTLAESDFVFVDIMNGTESPIITETPEVNEVEEDAEEDIEEDAEEVEISEHLFGKTNAKDVNVRKSASTKSKLMGKIAKKGTEIEIIESETDNSGEVWYRILWDKNEVYILGKFVDIATGGEYARVQEPSTVRSAAQRPNTQREATPRPTERPASRPTNRPTERPTQRPTNEPTRTPQTNVGGQVWIPTKGGKKYHSYSTCSNMDGPRQASLDEAIRLGFTACKRCH